MVVPTDVPTSDIDLHTDEALRDPYALYAELRGLGPVVYLRRYDMYALPRYESLREAALDWETFSSARGVAMTDTVNELSEGVTLTTDPPEHGVMREVLARPLHPDRLTDLTPVIQQEARAVVDRLVAAGDFDALELARHLPLSVVARQVGLGDHGRERMLQWASASFDAMGPMNQRTVDALPRTQEFVAFAMNDARPGRIDPKGWAAALYAAAARGELALEKCPFMVIDYAGPSLDTTINATSSAIWLFARHPDQWAKLREKPALVRHAINEVLRLESPIQFFTRLTTRRHELSGTTIPEGSRVILLYGSANRDERKYPDPDTFDITRRPSDHVAFGAGEHACVGMNLARLEIRTLLERLIEKVERFELLAEERAVHNILRGLRRLDVRAHPLRAHPVHAHPVHAGR